MFYLTLKKNRNKMAKMPFVSWAIFSTTNVKSKSEGKLLWTWYDINVCWILKDSVSKKQILVQKGPPKITFFEKYSFFYWGFLVPKYWVTLLKYRYCKMEGKNWPISTKKICQQFSNKEFWKGFVDFFIFYLILRINPHVQLFFQLSSCTGWSTVRYFQIFWYCFLPFLNLSLSAGMFFFDKTNPPSLLLTVYRDWESC